MCKFKRLTAHAAHPGGRLVFGRGRGGLHVRLCWFLLHDPIPTACPEIPIPAAERKIPISAAGRGFQLSGLRDSHGDFVPFCGGWSAEAAFAKKNKAEVKAKSCNFNFHIPDSPIPNSHRLSGNTKSRRRAGNPNSRRRTKSRRRAGNPNSRRRSGIRCQFPTPVGYSIRAGGRGVAGAPGGTPAEIF